MRRCEFFNSRHRACGLKNLEDLMSTLESRLSVHRLRKSLRTQQLPPCAIATAYDYVGQDYGLYADGNAGDDRFGPDSRFAHTDAVVWETIRNTIEHFRLTGVSSLRVLDAGCGPGTWTRRVAA